MMAAASALLLWRFAAACAGSVVLALLLATLLPLAARRWPALAAHRATWLLAQGTVVLAFLLALPASQPLPHAAPLVPVTIDTPLPAIEPAQDDFPAAAGALGATRPAAPPAPQRFLTQLPTAWLPAAWLGVYLVGLAWHAARRVQASRRWHAQVLHHSDPVAQDDLCSWPAITPAQRERIARARLRVRTTALPMSPVLLGGRRRCLVLPAHLRTLALDQQHLIVEHELTHWRRADPGWLAVAGAATLLFWFNRPFAHLAAGLREAVELGCDDAVLAGRTMRERQGYAAALVAQLKLERGGMMAAPAFGQLGIADRVLRMRDAHPPRLAPHGRVLCAAAALLLAFGAVALQPAFSQAAADLPAAMPPAAATAATAAIDAWRYPIDRPRVTSLYGVQSSILPHGHHGVDFAARRGTPVLAVADGTVIEAAANPTWGNYVRIDHGGGRSSLAIHLERATVAYGQRVAAGSVIGAAGASGRATGPHLHFEYWQDGRRLDPALMLAGLDAHATSRALARRRSQGHPVPTEE